MKYNVADWDANPASLPEFLLQIRNAVEDLRLGKSQASQLIRQHLPTTVTSTLPLTMSYDDIVSRLMKAHISTGAYVGAVKAKIDTFDAKTTSGALRLFDYLESSYDAAKTLALTHFIEQCGAIQHILSRLDRLERDRAVEVVLRTGPDEQVKRFISYTRERADALRFTLACMQSSNTSTTSANKTEEKKKSQLAPWKKTHTDTKGVFTTTTEEDTRAVAVDEPNHSTYEGSRLTLYTQGKKSFSCPLKSCPRRNDYHALDRCSVFQGRSSMLRAALLVDLGRCLVCAKPHKGGEQACFKTKDKDTEFFCKNCNGFHHPMVCPLNFPKGEKVDGFSVFVGRATMQNDVQSTLFQTEILTLPNTKDSNVVFYDGGAAISFITNKRAAELNLKPVTKAFFAIAGIDHQLGDVAERPVYELRINDKHLLRLVGLDDITIIKGTKNAPELINRFQLDADAISMNDRHVDILIGADHAQLLPRFVRSIGDSYVLSRSVVTGKNILQGGRGRCGEARNFEGLQICHVKAVPTDQNNLFIEAESMGTEIPKLCKNCLKCPTCSVRSRHLAKKEHEELILIEKQLSFNPCTQRWVARYPKNDKLSLLTNNYQSSFKRLVSLERKLLKNKKTLSNFNVAFQDAVNRGLYRKITPHEAQYSGPIRYTPIVLVCKSSTTTPLRICSDSSNAAGGLSLNDVLIKGPPAINDLLGILLRFRVGKYAVVGDLAKFYNCVDSDPEDAHLRRILWRDMETDRQPDIYLTMKVNFGDLCGGVVAMTAARLSCDGYEESHPAAVNLITRDSYVDDLISSAGDEVELRETTNEADYILNKHGFQVKRWIFSQEGEETKVLGLPWNPSTDSLVLRPFFDGDLNVQTCSKRQFFSYVMALYDPLGFLSPLTVQLKLVLRRLAGTVKGWDDLIPTEMWDDAKLIMMEILKLNGHEIPRSIHPFPLSKGEKLKGTLVTFVDASSVALCSMVYLVTEHEDKKISNLVLSKTKIAPTPTPTVPKMELLAAQLGVRVAQKAEDSLSNVCINNKYFLTDSSIVLHQINKNSAQTDVFTTARVYEILTKSDLSQWMHISTDLNVSDIGTRTDATAEIIKGELFLQGPDFIKLPPANWPVRLYEDFKVISHQVLLVKPAVNLFDSFCFRGKPLQLCLKIVGWIAAAVIRFKQKINKVSNVQVPRWKYQDINGSITNDSKEAFNLGLQVAAALSGSDLTEQEMKNLLPYQKSIPGMEAKLWIAGLRTGVNHIVHRGQPLPILHARHELAKKIMSRAHAIHHGGVDATNSSSRKWAWILRSRTLAAKVTRSCYQCTLASPRYLQQVMGALPPARVRPTPPFFECQLDLAGPFTVKCTFHPRQPVKVWVMIASCQSLTGAVYLSTIDNYSAEAVSEGLLQLAARYGPMGQIQTDAGPNVVRAVEIFNSQSTSPANHVQIPPRAQHRNGRAERYVGLFKKLIGPVAKLQRKLSFTQLQLLLKLTEDKLNQRPLYLPGTGDQMDASNIITPNHLLRYHRTQDGQESYSRPKNLGQLSDSLKKIYTEVVEYISNVVYPTIGPLRKWRAPVEPLAKGTVVAFSNVNPLLKDSFNLGIIEDSVPSASDKRIRTYLIKTRLDGKAVTKTLPVTKLILLEAHAEADLEGECSKKHVEIEDPSVDSP